MRIGREEIGEGRGKGKGKRKGKEEREKRKRIGEKERPEKYDPNHQNNE